MNTPATPSTSLPRTMISAAISFVLLGLALPYAVVWSAINRAYEAGAWVVSPFVLAGVWLVLMAISLTVGWHGRRSDLGRGFLAGSLTSLGLLALVVGIFLLRNA